MRQIGLILLVAASQANADDTFNCPPIGGTVIFDQRAANAMLPTHMDKIAPSPWTIDYACKVDATGRLANCRFASREVLTPEQESLMQRIMPRMMAKTRTDVPNQRCVAGKLTFAVPDAPGAVAP